MFSLQVKVEEAGLPACRGEERAGLEALSAPTLPHSPLDQKGRGAFPF